MRLALYECLEGRRSCADAPVKRQFGYVLGSALPWLRCHKTGNLFPWNFPISIISEVTIFEVTNHWRQDWYTVYQSMRTRSVKRFQ